MHPTTDEKLEYLVARLRASVYGPEKCPECCNVRSHVTGEVENFQLAEPRYFEPHDPADGCHSEGQCDWNMRHWPGEQGELILAAATQIERLRRDRDEAQGRVVTAITMLAAANGVEGLRVALVNMLDDGDATDRRAHAALDGAAR
jgi:hypothetical protein